MSDSFAFIMLKDEFYDEYNIPKLPIPLKVERPGKSLETSGMSFPQMVDNLIAFLEEEPAEVENYRILLSTMSYYAGTGEISRQQWEQAYKYLKISRKYGYIKNMSVIEELGMVCLILEKYEEARDVFFFGYAVTKNHEFLPEIWEGLVNSECLVGNVEGSIKLIHNYFAAGYKRYPTSHPALYHDLSVMVDVTCKDDRVLQVMEQYNTPDYPGFLGDQG